MFNVGRICVKLAGRDAGLKCIVIEVIDQNMVMIDGETRRRKCNIDHLEPLNQTADIKKGASHEEVNKVFEKLGLTARNTTPKTAAAKPVTLRKGSDSTVKDAKVVKPAKKAVKKTVKTEAKENAEETEKKAPAKKKVAKKATEDEE